MRKRRNNNLPLVIALLGLSISIVGAIFVINYAKQATLIVENPVRVEVEPIDIPEPEVQIIEKEVIKEVPRDVYHTQYITKEVPVIKEVKVSDTEEIKKLQEQIAKLEEDSKKLKEENNNLNNTKTDWETHSKCIQKDLDYRNEEVATYKKLVDSLTTQKTILEGENKKLNDKVTALEAEIEQLKAQPEPIPENEDTTDSE